MSCNDIGLCLKGYVPLEHVVEKNAQRPDSGGDGVIAMFQHPLRRAIHSSSWNHMIVYAEDGE